MSSIKLIPASGGGSVSLAPPNSTSGSDVTITLPSETKTLAATDHTHSGGVLEEFFYPCAGGTVTTSAGDITFENVTGVQNGTTSHVDLTGSTVAYTPPAGTKTVVYKFSFLHSKASTSSLSIGYFKFYIDSDEVTKAYICHQAEDLGGMITFEWPITISNSADTTIGQVNGWSSSKTLKLTYREHASTQPTKCHATYFTEQTSNSTFVMPRIGITALSL